MYSLVLLATLTTGASSADFCCGFLSKCFSSCYGCSGACYGCGGCGGCYGASCYGGCFGRGCGGGSCVGWGCSGACYGAGCSGFSSGYSYSGHGCYGCYGCYGCAGANYSTAAYAPAYSTSYGSVPYTNGYSEGMVTTFKAPVAADSARLVVNLPADAKLYVDGTLTKTSDKAVRSFRTPTLAAGEQYVYTLKAEVVREGKTLTESKQVIVSAGIEAKADFAFPAESVASK